MLMWPWGTNFSEILIGIHTFSFKKIHFKMSSAKLRPFCLGLNKLMGQMKEISWVTPTPVPCVIDVIWHCANLLANGKAVINSGYDYMLWIGHPSGRLQRNVLEIEYHIQHFNMFLLVHCCSSGQCVIAACVMVSVLRFYQMLRSIVNSSRITYAIDMSTWFGGCCIWPF